MTNHNLRNEARRSLRTARCEQSARYAVSRIGQDCSRRGDCVFLMFALAVFLSHSIGVADAIAVDETIRRPNIILILADDHTTQAISAYRHPLELVKTPNIDRLADEGMLFQRALVPNSICAPSRAAILTGKYSHKNGIFRNWSTFDGTQQTLPKLLRNAGYQTALIGKWHLRSQPVGFDHWEILPGQGRYYNPPMSRDGEEVEYSGYTTDIINDLTIKWLKKQRDKSKPFMLMSQHKGPHREWAPALRHLGWNNDRPFREPPTLFDDFKGRGEAERQQEMMIAESLGEKDLKLIPPSYLTPEQRRTWDEYYVPRNKVFEKAALQGDELLRWKYQRYLHDYLGTILALDEGVGRLLNALEEEGLAENTVVVYCSDQGFFLGEHGWFDKRWIYEESLTTPLIVRWPGVVQPGSRQSAMVSILDLPETFLEIANVAVPDDMQGRSLVPLLRGEFPADWRKSFYYQYFEHPGWHQVRRHAGVVTDRYKLFHFYQQDMNYWTLIDRKLDPHELTNVYNDPAYTDIRKKLHAEYDRLRAELEVPAIDPPGADPVEDEKRALPPPKSRSLPDQN